MSHQFSDNYGRHYEVEERRGRLSLTLLTETYGERLDRILGRPSGRSGRQQLDIRQARPALIAALLREVLKLSGRLRAIDPPERQAS